MEKNGNDQLAAASDSRRLDNNNNRPTHHHSQWLHSTLAEMDRKIKMILELVEDNGDTFGERAEMYYKNRPQLIRLVGDVQISYRALADKYDLILRSDSLSLVSTRVGSRSNSFKLPHAAAAAAAYHHQDHYCKEGGVLVLLDDIINTAAAAATEEEESAVMLTAATPNNNNNINNYKEGGRVTTTPPPPPPDHLINSTSDHLGESQSNVVQSLVAMERNSNPNPNPPMSMSISSSSGVSTNTNGQLLKLSKDDNGKREKMWNEMRMKVSKLIEDNLSQQSELIKRNDDKRESIKQLGLYIDQLQNENQCLKKSLLLPPDSHSHLRIHDHDVKKQNRSHMSKFKGLFFTQK